MPDRRSHPLRRLRHSVPVSSTCLQIRGVYGPTVDANLNNDGLPLSAWRNRYQAAGWPGWKTETARPGRPREIDRAEFITATLKALPPPKKLDVTHWSARLTRFCLTLPWRSPGISTSSPGI